MTGPKRTNSTLRGMLTRRDRKIEALTAQLTEARRVADDAVLAAKRVLADNRALRNNLEVLSRPKHKAHRNRIAGEAVEALRVIKCLHKSVAVAIESYEKMQRKSL